MTPEDAIHELDTAHPLDLNTAAVSAVVEKLAAELAQRDARIAELEAQAGEGTSSNKYRAELYDEVWQAARDMGYDNVTGALQELAALKAQQPSACVIGGTGISSSMRGALAEAGQQPASGGAYSSDPLACSGCATGCFRCRSSAGVVVGALVSALEGIVHDERVPNEVSQDYAALLIEARRLNHCRAQAVPDGWRDVQAERQRQISAEGWTPEHDAEHDGGELAAAGAAYALHAADHLHPYSQGDGGNEAPSCWPWHDELAGRGEGPVKTKPAWWKPGTPRRNLVKAGALILAEIERLDRAAAPSAQQKESGDE